MLLDPDPKQKFLIQAKFPDPDPQHGINLPVHPSNRHNIIMFRVVALIYTLNQNSLIKVFLKI